jgi:hypothetical protein
MSCALLRNFDQTPSCPHYDFVTRFSLNDMTRAADVIPELRTGEVVDLNGRFFAIEGAPLPYQEAPDSVERSVPQKNVMSLDAMSEHARDAVMHDLMYRPVSTKPESDDDDNWVPTQDEWEQIVGGRSKDRFGVHYRFLGRSLYDAFVEPFLWNHSCEFGTSKFTGKRFTYDEAENQRFDRVVDIATRIVFAEFQLREADKANDTVTTCACCGFPMPAARLQYSKNCVICAESDQIGMYDSLVIQQRLIDGSWTRKVRPFALKLARVIMTIDSLVASPLDEIVKAVRPSVAGHMRKVA